MDLLLELKHSERVWLVDWKDLQYVDLWNISWYSGSWFFSVPFCFLLAKTTGGRGVWWGWRILERCRQGGKASIHVRSESRLTCLAGYLRDWSELSPNRWLESSTSPLRQARVSRSPLYFVQTTCLILPSLFKESETPPPFSMPTTSTEFGCLDSSLLMAFSEFVPHVCLPLSAVGVLIIVVIKTPSLSLLVKLSANLGSKT